MKKTMLVILLLILTTLTGCDLNPQEIIDEIDEEINNTTDPNDDSEIPNEFVTKRYEDLDDEAALTQYFADFNAEYDRLGSLSADTTYTANIYNTSNQLIRSEESEFSVKIDTVDQYCDISVVVPYQIYNFLETELHDIVDGRTGTLRHYSLVAVYVDVLDDLGDTTFEDYMDEVDPYLDASLFTSITRTDTFTFTATIDQSSFVELGLDEFYTIYNIDIPSEMTFTISIDEYYVGRIDIDYTSDLVAMDIEDTSVYYETIMQTVYLVRDAIPDKISVYEHPYVMTLPSSIEGILSSRVVGDYNIHGFLMANQSGFVRFDLEPGVYMSNIESIMGVEATVYTIDGSIIEWKDRMQITENTTLFIEFYSAEEQVISFYIDELDLVDIVTYELDNIYHGTISGYMEGALDMSYVTFNQIAPSNGVFVIDASNVLKVNRDDSLMLVSDSITLYCDLVNTDDYCYGYVHEGQSIDLTMITFTNALSFEFDYAFYPEPLFTTEYNTMPTLDDLNGTPVYLYHDEIESRLNVELAFTIESAGSYYFVIENLVNPYSNGLYRIYHEDGTEVSMSLGSYYNLGVGNYYIEIYSEYNNIYVLPTLVKVD